LNIANPLQKQLKNKEIIIARVRCHGDYPYESGIVVGLLVWVTPLRLSWLDGEGLLIYRERERERERVGRVTKNIGGL